MSCRNSETFVDAHHNICTGNISTAVDVWVNTHLVLLFIMLLLLIAVCTFFEGRKRSRVPDRTNNVNYQLQQLNNNIADIRSRLD